MSALVPRREVLAWTAGLFLAHQTAGLSAASESQALLAPPKNQKAEEKREPRIKRLRLKTHALAEMRHFYREVLGFPLLTETPHTLVFAAGATTLEFDQVTDDSKPYYHFAFNIPENKLEKARTWLQKRVPILKNSRTGETVIFFQNWNAHSLFFYDPAGNLVELIARHTLNNATGGPFTLADILYVSEIGLVPPEQERVFAQIRDGLNISPYLASTSFLGDEHGILIVILQNILWIPEYKKGGILCPTHITVTGHGNRAVPFKDLPFTLTSEET